MSTTMNSARQRVPTSGRSNRSDVDKLSSSRPRTSTASCSSYDDERTKFNDTLRFFRPFSPRDPYAHEDRPMKPILPRSLMEPTIPAVDPPPRLRRNPSCPKEWMNESQKPDPFERSSLERNLGYDEKQKHCREFIERNVSELWKYNQEYAQKTPRTLCNDLVNDRNFVGIMAQNHQRERILKLSNSNSTKSCLTFEQSSNDRFENPTAYNDPFAASLTTSRNTKNQRMQTLFAPALQSTEKRFNRGYEHAPEYGNFSKYNSILRTNKGAVLKR
jgi:hypothetical protein